MFKDKLKELREKEGLSQQELADKLFVSRSAVAKWENGNGIPSDVNLDTICKFFDIDKKQLKPKNEDYAYTKGKKIKLLILLISIITIDLLFLCVGTISLTKAYKDKIKYYEDIVFYEKSVIIRNTNDFKMTEEHLNILNERFDYVNKCGEDFFHVDTKDTFNSERITIEIHFASSNFVNTGVVVEDSDSERFFYRELQKIDLLYGDVFNDESTLYEIVIDLDTSLLYFGKENSVGETLCTTIGDFKVIGVVSNTIEREVSKEANEYKGKEWLYPTQAYVSHALAIKLSEDYKFGFDYDNQVIVITDKEKSASEIKHIIEILFNIEENDKFALTTRDSLLELYTYDINLKTNIIYAISTVLFLIIIISGIFIYKVVKELRKIKTTK